MLRQCKFITSATGSTSEISVFLKFPAPLTELLWLSSYVPPAPSGQEWCIVQNSVKLPLFLREGMEKAHTGVAHPPAPPSTRSGQRPRRTWGEQCFSDIPAGQVQLLIAHGIQCYNQLWTWDSQSPATKSPTVNSQIGKLLLSPKQPP